MGDTIHVSVRGAERADLRDYSLMLRLESYLDRLCVKLKVAKLSDFYDGGALAAEYLDELGGEVPGDVLAEHWFDAAPALAAVRTILTRLEQNFDELGFRPDASRAHWPTDLMDELRDCAATLED